MKLHPKLKKYWDENPLEVIAVASGAAIAVAKVIEAMSSAQSRHAYTKQVNYRVKTKR